MAGVLPAAAQKRGSFELGAFAAYLNADNSLAVGNSIGFGGRAGVNLFPYLALEVDYATASANGAKYTPLHVYAVYEVPPVSSNELFLGFGYVKNKYTGSYEAKDSGVGGLVGLRHRLNKAVAFRVDGRVDFGVREPHFGFRALRVRRLLLLLRRLHLAASHGGLFGIGVRQRQR